MDTKKTPKELEAEELEKRVAPMALTYTDPTTDPTSAPTQAPAPKGPVHGNPHGGTAIKG